jgi:hypothetical protein
MGRRGRRGKWLEDVLKEKRRFWKLKGEALNCPPWGTPFGRGYEPVAIQTTG